MGKISANSTNRIGTGEIAKLLFDLKVMGKET
jgi:hypothetical protein